MLRSWRSLIALSFLQCSSWLPEQKSLLVCYIPLPFPFNPSKTICFGYGTMGSLSNMAAMALRLNEQTEPEDKQSVGMFQNWVTLLQALVLFDPVFLLFRQRHCSKD